MLRDLGCAYAIVGHSERRGMHGETDTVVASKAHRLIDAGICPIICVGESLAQRQSHLTEAVLAHQIDAVVGVIKSGAAVVAYEPLWAIGSGRAATPEMAQGAHAFIRARLQAGGAPGDRIRVIYGGSVSASSASALFAQPDIDGALVGGASRIADDFVAICESATQSKF
jgi:triosephosphate isomerase